MFDADDLPEDGPPQGFTFTPTLTDDQQYQNDLVEKTKELTALKMAGTPLDAELIISGLDPNRNNSKVRTWALDNTEITAKQWDGEMRRARIREILGAMPVSPSHLVALYADDRGARLTFDGRVKRRPNRMIDGKPVTDETIADWSPDDPASIYYEIKFPTVINLDEFEREIRMQNTDLKIGFAREDIHDAVNVWAKERKLDRVNDIYGDLCFENAAPHPEAAWLELAERVFDCSDSSPAFVAAVLKKFMWQVKRKLLPRADRPVTNHLMPVILGPQGVGKSTFVRRMISPARELTLDVDFRMISDDRNAQIWESFVMFVDEMGFASKSDVDVIKNCITAETLTRRPMRTNNMISITQNATFIGCSNRELAQLIRDPTGIRRFVALRMRKDVDRDYVNGLDFRLFWGSVKHEAADPMIGHETLLGELQEESREIARVEAWMRDFDPDANAYTSLAPRDGWLKAADLFEVFRAFEDVAYPGSLKTNLQEFGHEMKRIASTYPDAMIFEKKRTNRGICYRWKHGQRGGAGRGMSFRF